MYVYTHYVYIIENAHGELYIGRTGNLKARLAHHRKGKTQTTAAMKEQNFNYVHIWQVPNLSWASKLEQWLQRKSWSEILDIMLDVPMWCKYLKKECCKVKVDDLGRFQISDKMLQREISKGFYN